MHVLFHGLSDLFMNALSSACASTCVGEQICAHKGCFGSSVHP